MKLKIYTPTQLHHKRKVVKVEDLRAWLEDKIKEHESPDSMHYWEKKTIARELLAELDHTPLTEKNKKTGEKT